MLIAVPGQPALAHANLVSSFPENGASLAFSPEAITLEFSEKLDPGYSTLTLVDPAGRVVVPGPALIGASGLVMRLAVPSLPDGVYSALWNVRSLVDGHITKGVVSFAVGESTPPVSMLLPPGTPEPAAIPPDALEVAIRWLGYLMSALLVGPLAFGALVWAPAIARSEQADPASGEGVTRLIRRTVVVGGIGLLVATLALLIFQTSQVISSAAAPGAWWSIFLQILGGRSGALAGVRALLVGAIIAMSPRLPPPSAETGFAWRALTAFGGLMLVTFSLQSHAAAQQNLPSVILDWVHMAGASVWVGGLLILSACIGLPGLSGYQGQPPLRVLVPRFTVVALASVVVIAVSGVINLFVQAGSLAALFRTVYGYGLVAKVALFAGLVALGAVNMRLLTPRLADAGGAGAFRMFLTSRIELGLMALALLAAGLLTASIPAGQALEEQAKLGYIGHASHDGVDIRFLIAPAEVGSNEFGVDIVDHRPGVANAPAQVLLRFKSLSVNTGETQAETTTEDQARFTVRGAYLSIGGEWQVLVIVRRPGFYDVSEPFRISLPNPPAAIPTPVGTPEPDYPNPVEVNAGSLAQGKVLYEANCIACHGPQGKGDGPVGLTLNPRPADLSIHTEPGVHTDAMLYEWISDGYLNTAMPAFRNALSDEERWSLVNYIRTLYAPP
jgi:copper transport protein